MSKVSAQLRDLTRDLLAIAKLHGPKSAEAQDFIRSNSSVDGFEDVALTMLLLIEESHKHTRTLETSPILGARARGTASTRPRLSTLQEKS
jgi:hypothetical protein